MHARNLSQTRLCIFLTLTLSLGVCVNALPSQDAQQAQLQQASAQYLASQGTNQAAAARVQGLLMQSKSDGGQTVSKEEAQAIMLHALKNAQTDPGATQSVMPSGLMQSARRTQNESMRNAGFGGPAQSAPASPLRNEGPIQSGDGAVALPAKKAGIVRVGVLAPDAQVKQNQAGAAKISESLRTLIVNELSGPLVELIPITSMIPMQVEAEAKQHDCNYLLYNTLVQKQTGGAGVFLRKAGALAPMISMIPMAGGLGEAMTGVAASGALGSAGNLVSLVKAKDQWTLTFKLVAPGDASPVLTNSNQATARSDGEDVVKGLIDQEAISVINQLAQKR